MSAESVNETLNESVQHELNDIRKQWWCLLLLGCLLLLCGTVAITFPFFSSIGAAIAIGTVLLISGLATIITSFWTGNWSAFLLQLLVGILYTVMGLAITDAPVVSMMALTLLVASFAIVAGVFRVTSALVLRFPQWGWTLLNGLVTAVFGVMILRHVPEASLWLIGTLIGVELIFNGMTWVMLSLELRTLSVNEGITSAQPE